MMCEYVNPQMTHIKPYMPIMGLEFSYHAQANMSVEWDHII